MEIIGQIIGWVLFIISSTGLMYLTNKLLKTGHYSTPIVTISLVAIGVYLGGILGVLNISVYIILILGIVGAVYLASNVKNIKFRVYDITINSIVFWAISLMFFILLLSLELEHYDNFSHWGIVVKDMFITEAIPSATSELIDFKNYPLGITSFIYYVCKLIGYNEGYMLFAQGLIIYSCFYAIFGIIEEKKRFLLYMVLGTLLSTLAIFNIAIRINTLLVDLILPILALAIIATIYQYRHKLMNGYRVILPMLGLLMIVKNTGVIFVGYTLIYLMYETYRYSKGRPGKFKIWLAYIATIIGSGLTSLIWSTHMKLNFADVSNKFEVNLDAVNNGLGQKTNDQIQMIITNFFETIFDIRFLSTSGIIIFTVIALGSTLIASKVLKKKWKVGKVSIIGLAMVITYYLGILGMYIFSMPACEAVVLAGFERYVASIVLLYGGIIAMCITLDIENSFEYKIGNKPDYKSFKSLKTKRAYNNAVVVLSAISFLIISSEYNGLTYNKNIYEGSVPNQIKILVGDKWDNSLDENKYLVYCSNHDSRVENNYVKYTMKYYLYSDKVNVFNNINDEHTKDLFYNLGIEYTDEGIDDIDRLLKHHDKLIILDPLDESTKEILSDRYDIESLKEGVYSIDNIIKTVAK